MTDTTDKLSLQQLKDVRELCLPHTAWRSIIDELISARDQLEAERQRADEDGRSNTLLYAGMKQRAEKAEAEISALKVKLANPVVLPERKKAEFYVDEEFSNKDLAEIYNAARLEFKVKILNAGFTVKGE